MKKSDFIFITLIICALMPLLKNAIEREAEIQYLREVKYLHLTQR